MKRYVITFIKILLLWDLLASFVTMDLYWFIPYFFTTEDDRAIFLFMMVMVGILAIPLSQTTWKEFLEEVSVEHDKINKDKYL